MDTFMIMSSIETVTCNNEEEIEVSPSFKIAAGILTLFLTRVLFSIAVIEPN